MNSRRAQWKKDAKPFPFPMHITSSSKPTALKATAIYMHTLRCRIIDTIDCACWPGGKHPGLVFGRCSVGIPAILTEVFRGFTQSLQENAETVSLLAHGLFLPNPFQFVIQIHESFYHSVLYDINPQAACSPLDFPLVNSTGGRGDISLK
jgi:hypothetical protein